MLYKGLVSNITLPAPLPPVSIQLGLCSTPVNWHFIQILGILDFLYLKPIWQFLSGPLSIGNLAKLVCKNNLLLCFSCKLVKLCAQHRTTVVRLDLLTSKWCEKHCKIFKCIRTIPVFKILPISTKDTLYEVHKTLVYLSILQPCIYDVFLCNSIIF